MAWLLDTRIYRPRGPRQDSEYISTEDHQDCLPKTLPRSNPTVQGKAAPSLGTGLPSHATGQRGSFLSPPDHPLDRSYH